MESLHVSDWKPVSNLVFTFSDGWGQPLRIVENSNGTVELQSAGVDGIFGTLDDVVVNL